MRRVFPLRPAETSLLVTYDNGTFEHEDADTTFADAAPSASARNLKLHHRRRSSTNFSFDNSLPSPSRNCKPLPLQKLPSSADYPEFAEVASPSPVSSLWTSSFREDGDSTSFNFSDGMRRRHRHASDTSSSSSSSLNFNPADTRSYSAISAIKDVDALLDTASSSDKAPKNRPDTGDAAFTGLKCHLHVKTRIPDVDTRVAKPTLKALAFAEPQGLVQPETPTYVIPEKVEKYMQNCLGMPPKVAPSLSSASTPKASNRLHGEFSADHVCLPRHAESPPRRRAVTKSPIYRKEAESCSCSTPFKYLAKCLRADKDKPLLVKEGYVKQSNSPAKFSTLANRLYSPQLSPRGRLPLEGGLDLSTATPSLLSRGGGDTSTATARSFSRERVRSKLRDTQSLSDQNWQSPLKCQSFGSSLVNDYVRRLQEEGKSVSFRKVPSSASFRYDTDSGISKVSRPRLGSMDFTLKSIKFDRESLTRGSEQRLDGSQAKVPKGKPYSMDISRNLDRNDSTRSSEAEFDNSYLDYSSSDLFAAEEKNSESLALLTREINKLCKEKRYLAKELSVEMKARHRTQESAESVIKQMEVEMEEKLISVEKDHAYAQVCLEQEMERRRNEWSAKLDKIRREEKRLRDRVTEMALERVELQKAIALYKSREASLQAQAKDHELSAQTWMRRHHQSEEEVMFLRNSFTNACKKLSDKEHELDLLSQRSKALERENAELVKDVSRLRKAYADQAVTFEELWQRLVEIVNSPSDSRLESLRRFYSELKAFSVKEQALRYEMAVLQLQFLHSKQRPNSEDESLLLSSGRMCSPKDQSRASKNLTGKSLEAVENLVNKLELTKQHTRRVEHQLEVKEEEVELLHSALQEREVIVKEMEAELTSVKAHRDGLRKQVQEMSQDAIRLTRDLTELKQVVEKLDDELMLKEGEISILRETCSDSDF